MLNSNPEIFEIKENYYSNKTPSLGGSKSQRQVKASIYSNNIGKDSIDEKKNKMNDYNDSVEDNISNDNNNKTCKKS